MSASFGAGLGTRIDASIGASLGASIGVGTNNNWLHYSNGLWLQPLEGDAARQWTMKMRPKPPKAHVHLMHPRPIQQSWVIGWWFKSYMSQRMILPSGEWSSMARDDNDRWAMSTTTTQPWEGGGEGEGRKGGRRRLAVKEWAAEVGRMATSFAMGEGGGDSINFCEHCQKGGGRKDGQMDRRGGGGCQWCRLQQQMTKTMEWAHHCCWYWCCHHGECVHFTHHVAVQGCQSKCCKGVDHEKVAWEDNNEMSMGGREI